MIELKQIRRDIKKIGFNYRIKKYSDFDFMQFYHIESKKEFPDIFTDESLVFWSNLIEYIKVNKIKEIK